MKGLLYKEFCMVKAQIKSWMLVFLVLTVYGAVFKNVSIIFSITAVVGLINALNTFTYDKMYQCEPYIGTLPVSRKKIVLSKYVFLFCLDSFFFTIMICLAIFAYVLFPGNGESLMELLASAAGVGAVTVCMQALIVPVAYAFGPDKARFSLIIFALIPTLLVIAGKEHLTGLGKVNLMGLIYTVPAVIICLMFLSIMTSVLIYQKKEL